MQRLRVHKACLILAPSLFMGVGCAVPQPRGQGLYQYVQEPTTKAWYHLYLPVDYVKNNGRYPNGKLDKWPLVMSFHGMKPYDNALPQEREWEKEADMYGYVVCAPELLTSDSFMEYPLTREHSYVLRDKQNVIAIMDHVFRTTRADPERVLSTSWSCGGYLAHYFPNRFPNRFSCIATRLSNFSSRLMSEQTVPHYKHRVPVAVFIGDGDFPACKVESEEAVAWYQARGFRVVRGKMIDNMGHQRIPQTAAAFFAEQMNLEPLHPEEAAKTVALVQMTEYYPPQELLARFSPPSGLELGPSYAARTESSQRRTGLADNRPAVPPATSPAKPPPTRTTPQYASVNPGREYPVNRAPAYDPTPRRVTEQPSRQVTTRTEPNSLVPAKPAPSTAQPRETARTASPDSVRDRARSAVASAKPEPARLPPPSRPAARPPGPAPRDERLARASTPNRSAERDTVRFNPQQAGAREYPAATVSPRTSPASASNAARTNGGPATVTAAPSRSKRVNIRLSGPWIGTAPHYVAYSADLPREKLEGADFLWMDNGVWISDEARGVKILDSPGLHRISVLIVTRDDEEYRGVATVQVLERGSVTASAYRSSGRPSAAP